MIKEEGISKTQQEKLFESYKGKKFSEITRNGQNELIEDQENGIFKWDGYAFTASHEDINKFNNKQELK